MALELLALHLLGDFVLQNEWMARNKLTSIHARLVHVAAYGCPFLFWGLFSHGQAGVSFASAVMVTHFLVDSRRFAANHPWPPKSILIDQSLHVISLALLARLFL